VVGGEPVEDITITNQNGESICLGHRGPFFLEKIEGLGEVGVGIESQKAPHQDGSTYIDNTLENRALSMEGTIIAKGNPEALPAARRKLQRVLNPKLGEAVIIYRQGERVKEITGMAESTPVFPGGKGRRGHYYQKFLLHLICHQPFWQDQFTESREIVTWIGGMTFPLLLPARFAMKGLPVINVVNMGDVETPVKIEFQGPATNPKIENRTTGEYIQVQRNLSLGDTLLLTTDFGAKRVEINGVNAFHYIDLNSVFWQLRPGDNIVEYSSDEPTEPAAVVISYRNRYVGV
jgi:hypothetical protein